VLWREVADLPGNDGRVLALYYGAEGQGDNGGKWEAASGALSYREIGDRLGVSRERVRQIHGRALDRLRGRLAERHATLDPADYVR